MAGGRRPEKAFPARERFWSARMPASVTSLSSPARPRPSSARPTTAPPSHTTPRQSAGQPAPPLPASVVAGGDQDPSTGSWARSAMPFLNSSSAATSSPAAAPKSRTRTSMEREAIDAGGEVVTPC
uniref:Uncharacterized protein n=1 Tax=Arundo donax TaxID=35708 RepID=A0A0A9DTX8_ARUDO